MDNLFRLVTYLIIGAVLLYGNIWCLRTLRAAFQSNEYVIMPIKLIGQEDKDGARGIGLAVMLQARLKQIEGEIADAQQQFSATQSKKPVTPRSLPGVNAVRFIPLINAETVRLPTSLLEPANINVTVGGVQVGGVVLWIQNLLVRQRTLSFTFYLVDANKTIVAGDAKPLSGTDNGAIWFEARGSQDKVISELSYELLLKHLTNDNGKRIDSFLSRAEFQIFADALVQAAKLNGEDAIATVPRRDEFGAIFQKIWPVASKHASGWPEFGYFAANLAESAGDNEKAAQLYADFKEAASTPGASANVIALIKDGTVDRKIASLSASPTGPPEPNGRFDYPVTMAGSTANSVVYYQTALGSLGSTIAEAVMGKFESDFARLTEFFGGAKLPKHLNIVIAALDPTQGGSGGAYHHSCSDETLYIDVKTKPALDTDYTNSLIVSQAVDVFGAAQNKGWNCGFSSGAALKRVLAATLYPAELKDYATAAAWLDTADRPDWVNKNNPTDIDPVSNGCEVLFLNYMHTQLKIPWEKIVQTGGTNLGQTYANLGLGNDGFAKFRQLMNAKFPIGRPSRLTTDNPFPL
jgi:hypothetical protein